MTDPARNEAGTVEAGDAGAAPVDRMHLGRYTLGDSRIEREILYLFMMQVPLTVESLKFAATDRDWRVAAHTLKGSARAVGAWKVGRLAQEAEGVIGIVDRAGCLDIIAKIEEAAGEVERYLALEFPEPQAEARQLGAGSRGQRA